MSRAMLKDYGSPELNAIAIYKWRTRLCAGAFSKTPKPFLCLGTPRVFHSASRKCCRLWRSFFLSKYSQFAGRLDFAVGDASMEELTGRSPTKAELKAIGRQLPEVAEQAEEGRAATTMELDKVRGQLATEVCL